MYSQPSHRSDRIAPVPEVGLPDDFGTREGEGVDLKNVLRTLWMGKWIIAVVTILAIALGVYMVRTAVPLYEAEATVVYRPEQQPVPGIESVVAGAAADEATINTETAIFQARSLLDRVVAEMDLESDPEFNPKLRPPGWVDEVRGRILALFSTPEPSNADELRRRQAAIDLLESKLDVTTVPDSYVFVITALTENPQKSAEVANTLTRIYIRRQLESQFESQRDATDWLTERVAELKADLESAEAAVEAFSSGTSFVNETTLLAQTQQLKDLRRRLDERQERMGEIAESMATVRELRDGENYARIASELRDPRLQNLAERIGAASGEADRSERVEAFDTALDLQMRRLEREAEQVADQSAVLESSISEMSARVDANSSDLVELRQLQREAEASRLIYEYFLGRLKEASAQQGMQKADSHILSAAVAPDFPAYPRAARSVALFAVMGMLLGAALVFLREHMKSTFRAPEELEQQTGLSVLGIIPKAPSKTPLGYISEHPDSSVAEALRNLRTSLLLTNLENRPQVITLTSSVPSEGKSSTTLMLAQISIALGNRVLVIECDNRRPTFAKHFGVANEHGLPAAIRGDISFEDAIMHDERTGLDVIFAQQSTSNAADMFSSARFTRFLEAMRERYHLIFLDTPPVLAVPDARIIAQASDALLYVVRWDSTTREQVRAGITLFRQVNARVTGTVLTQTNPSKMARYGYQGYGYGGGKATQYYAN